MVFGAEFWMLTDRDGKQIQLVLGLKRLSLLSGASRHVCTYEGTGSLLGGASQALSDYRECHAWVHGTLLELHSALPG